MTNWTEISGDDYFNGSHLVNGPKVINIRETQQEVRLCAKQRGRPARHASGSHKIPVSCSESELLASGEIIYAIQGDSCKCNVESVFIQPFFFFLKATFL